MFDEEFYKQFKACMEALMQSSVYPIATNDKQYQSYSADSNIAECHYLEICDTLSSAQREVIDALLDARDKSNGEFTNLCYIKGYFDCMTILNGFSSNIKNE
jgi:hypothetical protein